MQQSSSSRYLQQTTPWTESTSRVGSTVAVQIAKQHWPHSLAGSKYLLLSPNTLCPDITHIMTPSKVHNCEWELFGITCLRGALLMSFRFPLPPVLPAPSRGCQHHDSIGKTPWCYQSTVCVVRAVICSRTAWGRVRCAHTARRLSSRTATAGKCLILELHVYSCFSSTLPGT
jgi:hypothetical protein